MVHFFTSISTNTKLVKQQKIDARIHREKETLTVQHLRANTVISLPAHLPAKHKT
jgi:hypothetical protein